MTQLTSTTKVPPTPRVPFPVVVAVLAAVLAVAAIVVGGGLAIAAAQERSGLGMVSAGAAWLIGALSLMVAIHSWRS